MPSRFRPFLAHALILTAMASLLAAGQAEARAGRAGGFGSRGSRTWSAPPPTQTAPRQAAPIERSTAQPASPGPSQAAAAAQAGRGGFFSSRGGLLGGLFGAGLLGMLLGYGLFGGMGGFGSFLGLVLQIALIAVVARLALRWYQRRNQPAFAGATPPDPTTLRRDAGPQPRPQPGAQRGPMPGGAAAARTGAGRDEIGIGQADLEGFERLLGAVQAAYAAEDVNGLRRLATPEAAGFLAEDLAENARRGVVNHVTDVKLLQGDLAESWREGATDYATVAMRFALRDWTTERASGRVVEGDPNRLDEATEVWTFQRPRGGAWQLAAIQRT